MSYDLNGSADYFELSSAVVSAKPATLAAWVYRDNVGFSHRILCVGDGDAGATLNQIFIGVSSGNTAHSNQVIAGTSESVTGGSVSSGAWYHVCGVFPTSGNTLIYVNGSSTGGSISNSSPSAMDTTVIGCITNTSSTRTNFFDGKIAEAAVWDVALSADEVAALAKGMRPTKIRPPSLAFYVPLLGGKQDLIGGTDPTTHGSPATASIHPPMVY